MESKSYEPTEHDHQAAVFDWIRTNENLDSRLKAFFAVPNQRAWDFKQFAYFKKEGFKSGVSDIIGLVAQGGFNGIVIEMKRKGNKPTLEQIEFLQMCRDNGYKCHLCYSDQEAINSIKYYLSLGKS